MRATFRVLNTVTLWLFAIVGALVVLTDTIDLKSTPGRSFLDAPTIHVAWTWYPGDYLALFFGLAILITNVFAGRRAAPAAFRVLWGIVNLIPAGCIAFIEGKDLLNHSDHVDVPAIFFMCAAALLFLFFAVALLMPEAADTPVTAAPSKPPESFARIDSLDLLRGIAILGIFLMNTWTMSLPQEAYTNPASYAPDYVQGKGLPVPDANAEDHVAYVTYRPPEGSEYATYVFIHLFADMKFITMFSMMFGAGILLQGERAASRGLKPWKIHYGRMLVLLAMGLIHAYCIWYGDILTDYAMCGLMMFPLRKLPSTVLMILGIVMIAGTSMIFISHVHNYGLPVVNKLEDWSGKLVRSNNDFELTVYRNEDIDPASDVPDEVETAPAATRPVIAPVQGLPYWLGRSIAGWLSELKHRAWESFRGETVDFFTWSFLRCGGSILIGMALMRKHFFRGDWSRAAYVTMAATLIPIGWIVTYMGVVFNDANAWYDGWDRGPVFKVWGLGAEFNYWGSLLTEMGYIAFGVLLAMWAADPSRSILRACLKPIRAIGRTALSCYILENVIGTTLFYGHGFALFGKLWRAELLIVVAAVWALLLIVAPLWLKYFEQGPLEWVWHRIVYRARRAAALAGGGLIAAPIVSEDARPTRARASL